MSAFAVFRCLDFVTYMFTYGSAWVTKQPKPLGAKWANSGGHIVEEGGRSTKYHESVSVVNHFLVLM